MNDEEEKELYAKATWLIENGYCPNDTVESLVKKLKKTQV